jgi:hypothetical protein
VVKIIKDSLTPPGEFLSYMFLSGSLKVKVKHLGSECVDLKICVCKQFLVGLSRIMKHAVCILTRFPEFHMRTNFVSRLYIQSVCRTRTIKGNGIIITYTGIGIFMSSVDVQLLCDVVCVMIYTTDWHPQKQKLILYVVYGI